MTGGGAFVTWDPDSDEYLAILAEFIDETRETTGQLVNDLVVLEREASNADRFAAVLRAFHNIKGNCGWLSLSRLETLAHAAESMLFSIKEAGRPAGAEAVSTLLAATDAIDNALRTLEQTHVEGEEDYAKLLERLDAADSGIASPALQTASLPPEPRPEPDDMLPASDGTIRVDVRLLDGLMDQVGELVLARNQLATHVARLTDPAMLAASQRLDQVTAELQASIARTRMRPLSQLFNKLPRVVRDLSAELDKPVRLVVEGGETELDRGLFEAIGDPLLHLIRNAIDHGIEPGELRAKARKSPEALLTLRAHHAGGHVHIELSDDGRGLDLDAIRGRAIDAGLIAAAHANELGDQEIEQLIFEPGFSTAAEVTKVSGRGVGMDVVRTNIERIGGTVEIASTRGQGTQVRVHIPLTLAIISTLLASADDETYAIPVASIRELVLLDGRDGARGIETVHGAPVHRHRGRLLPLLDLRALLGLLPASQPATAEIMVVLEVPGGHFGLLVDAIHDIEDIVVKPLHPALRSLDCYAGATILGDGKVALILDPVGIARHGHISDCAQDWSELEKAATAIETATATATATEHGTLLVAAAGSRFAIPLAEVKRLEMVEPQRVEYAGPGSLVQYGDGVLRLLHLADLLEERRATRREALDPAEASQDDGLPVVVCGEGARHVGLVVDCILDIVPGDAEIKHRPTRQGVLGSAVIGGRITELLDLSGLLGEWEDQPVHPPGGA